MFDVFQNTSNFLCILYSFSSLFISVLLVLGPYLSILFILAFHYIFISFESFLVFIYLFYIL